MRRSEMRSWEPLAGVPGSMDCLRPVAIEKQGRSRHPPDNDPAGASRHVAWNAKQRGEHRGDQQPTSAHGLLLRPLRPIVTRQDPRERVPRCFRDGPPQDRRRADRDVGDHRRRREHTATEVGQRRQPAPSRLAATVAALRVAVGRLRARPGAHYIRSATRARGWST